MEALSQPRPYLIDAEGENMGVFLSDQGGCASGFLV
jgi:hypothetical protein